LAWQELVGRDERICHLKLLFVEAHHHIDEKEFQYVLCFVSSNRLVEDPNHNQAHQPQATYKPLSKSGLQCHIYGKFNHTAFQCRQARLGRTLPEEMREGS
jgi:hypothetical protein